MSDPAKPLGPAAQAFKDRALVHLAEPRWSSDHERAVTRAQASLIDPSLVAEGEELERLSSTPEGRRTLACRFAAKHIRYADAAEKQVKYVGPGNYQCRPAPDTRTAGQAMRDAADLLAILAPKESKVEITGDLSRMSDAEVRERARQLVASLPPPEDQT